MNIISISQMPTVVEEIPEGASGVHESTLRAYQILEKVKYLLAEGTPPHVVLGLIEEMEGGKEMLECWNKEKNAGMLEYWDAGMFTWQGPG